MSGAAIKFRFRHALFNGGIGFDIKRPAIEAQRHGKVRPLKNKLGGNYALDRGAVGIFRHGEIGRQTAADWEHIALPAAPHQGVTLAHHEAVAGVGECRRIVAALGAEVDAQRLVAAVDDIVEDRLVATLHVNRLQDKKIHRVLDATAFVLRRVLEIDDNFVVLGVRIDFAIGFTDDLFIGARDAEFMTVGEGLAFFDDELGDLGGRRCR